jgi:peptidoglycan hydrolase CwlO-like protein
MAKCETISRRRRVDSREIGQQLDQMGSRFDLKSDPEVKALKVSPEPGEVLHVIEETVQADLKETRKVGMAVEDITGELEAVQKEVKRTSGRLDEVVEDVGEIKRDVKEIRAERERS